MSEAQLPYFGTVGLDFEEQSLPVGEVERLRRRLGGGDSEVRQHVDFPAKPGRSTTNKNTNKCWCSGWIPVDFAGRLVGDFRSKYAVKPAICWTLPDHSGRVSGAQKDRKSVV